MGLQRGTEELVVFEWDLGLKSDYYSRVELAMYG